MEKYKRINQSTVNAIIGMINRALDVEEELNNKIEKGSIKLDKDLLTKILFIDENGVKTINEDIINALNLFDLSEIDFANAKVTYLDLEGTKANIDPQTVYEKDLSGGYFPLNFIGKSFENVKYNEVTDFTGSVGVPEEILKETGKVKFNDYEIEIEKDEVEESFDMVAEALKKARK